MIGLLLLARTRVAGGNRASLLDSLTITCGVGLLSWIFLIGPSVRSSGDLLVRLTAGLPPRRHPHLGDAGHLWSAGGLRNTAGRLLAIGAVGILVSDSFYGLANLHPGWNWHDGNPVDIGWIIFYGCWGAAALHPSMRALSEPRPAAPPRTSGGRLILLAAASLIAPAVLIVESGLHRTIDVPVIGGVAAAMFLLVLMRMAGLVRVHHQAMTRERVLRTAAADLVAAPGKNGIYEATITAVSALVSGHRGVAGMALAVSGPAGELAVVAGSGEPTEDKLLSLMSLRADVGETLARAKWRAGRSTRRRRPTDLPSKSQRSRCSYARCSPRTSHRG